MIASPQFADRLRDALAAVRDRVRDRLAAEVPADVAVIATDDGVALIGRDLAVRALTDARLRDLAGLVR
jgi:hypothetical protein